MIDKEQKKFRWLIFSLLVVLLFEFLSLSGLNLPPLIALPFFLTIILLVGHKTLLQGFQSVLYFQFQNISFLMTIAVLGSFYLGKYEEAAIVIVLYHLAEILEEFGIQRSQSSLTRLTEKIPKKAFIKGKDLPMSVDEVQIDDICLIKPGEMIPLDGKVVFGFSSVDESTITGEPIPKDKIIGDLVFGGTLNQQGYLEIKVTKRSKESVLSKIQKVTFEASQKKAQTQKFIEVFSSFYTPFVILLALFLTLIPTYFLNTPFNESFLNALTLLVIACPCALVISTPISIYAAIGHAASKGILIKGGRSLEILGRIKAMAFDKTRTLTFGTPTVTDVIPFGSCSKEVVLSCAAGIEIQSEHPLAKSITQAAFKKTQMPHPVENFEIQPGKGAKADCLICEDKHRCLGKLEFILEEHPVPLAVIEKIDLLKNDGKTVVIMCSNQQVEGIIGLLDKARPECREVIDELKNHGIIPIMLTGDNQQSAEAVGKSVNISDIRFNLLPEDKAKEMEQLLKTYKYVAMVGDGINDSPALAISSVGISMNELGSDTAIEAASIVILDDHLNKLPFLIRLGRKTLKTIQINIALAIFVKVIFISFALFGVSNLVLAIFSDVGMTVIVILNSLRLGTEFK